MLKTLQSIQGKFSVSIELMLIVYLKILKNSLFLLSQFIVHLMNSWTFLPFGSDLPFQDFKGYMLIEKHTLEKDDR